MAEGVGANLKLLARPRRIKNRLGRLLLTGQSSAPVQATREDNYQRKLCFRSRVRTRP
jgi:hypothetical protein